MANKTSMDEMIRKTGDAEKDKRKAQLYAKAQLITPAR